MGTLMPEPTIHERYMLDTDVEEWENIKAEGRRLADLEHAAYVAKHAPRLLELLGKYPVRTVPEATTQPTPHCALPLL